MQDFAHSSVHLRDIRNDLSTSKRDVESCHLANNKRLFGVNAIKKWIENVCIYVYKFAVFLTFFFYLFVGTSSFLNKLDENVSFMLSLYDRDDDKMFIM